MGSKKLLLNDLLTLSEAADVAGVSRQTIDYWIKKGVLTYIKKGAQRLFERDALVTASQVMAERGQGVKHRRGNRKKD